MQTIIEDNGYQAKILRDSISPDGVRLTTMEVTFPRFSLAEFNTHRVKSRNSASSRAIPSEKQIKKIKENPVIPIYWGKNQKGMQANQELSLTEQGSAIKEWLAARDEMVHRAQNLYNLGVHKQIVNRLLEPFMWHTVICTATEWSNFFALRCHPDTQPEFRKFALMMRDLYYAHKPIPVEYGRWHLPLLQDNEFVDYGYSDKDLEYINSSNASIYTIDEAKKICIGRCARVSYLTHDGRRDPQADINLCEKLQKSGHMSPFEHIARPMTRHEINKYTPSGFPGSWYQKTLIPFCGNFKGWIQSRKEIPYESDYSQNNTMDE